MGRLVPTGDQEEHHDQCSHSISCRLLLHQLLHRPELWILRGVRHGLRGVDCLVLSLIGNHAGETEILLGESDRSQPEHWRTGDGEREVPSATEGQISHLPQVQILRLNILKPYQKVYTDKNNNFTEFGL